ncbi:hypothetical protein [Microbulbifer sp. M83]|uniref:hypothetical protein n=1 Tax=Microbulbifer sp. M83 TaxID=3118246 RepID=UPI002FE3C603
MKAFLINALGLFGSWQLIDISSESTFRSGIAPVIFTFFLVSSLLWLVVTFGKDQRSGSRQYSGGDAAGISSASNGADGGGGDGGGGDC